MPYILSLFVQLEGGALGVIPLFLLLRLRLLLPLVGVVAGAMDGKATHKRWQWQTGRVTAESCWCRNGATVPVLHRSFPMAPFAPR